MDDIRLAMLHYDADTLMERPLNRVEEALPLLTTATTTWINIDGIHDIAVMEHIGRHFGLHPLTLEDVLNTTQRPKAEAFDDYLFVVMKMLHHDEKDDLIYSEQISLILGKNVLISFQESAGDVFEPVRERIRKGKGRIRTGGCDYLAYALIDAIVDNYFVILEKLGERLEILEEGIDDHPEVGILADIHTIRRELIYLRKQVWPLREIIAHFLKDDVDFICRRHLRHELYSHARADLALGLSAGVDDHPGHCRRHACFFQAQEMGVNRDSELVPRWLRRGMQANGKSILSIRCCAARPIQAENSPRFVGAKKRSRSSGPRGGFNGVSEG